MENKNKRVIIVSIVALAIVLISVTYAYFSARITGLESASTISMTAGRMGIEYSEGDENISVSDIYPKSEAWITKTITLTGYNTTALDMEYDLGIQIDTNTFKGGQLTFDLTGVGANGTKIADITGKSIVGHNRFFKIGTGSFSASDGDTHVYTLKIYFKENGLDQNINQSAVFNGKITVSEKGGIIASRECIYDGELTPGTTYQKDQYTYIYKQKATIFGLQNITDDGWSVLSTETYKNFIALLNDDDYTQSSDPIEDEICTSINGKPIVIMDYLFANGNATSLDLSSFDTSNVVSMDWMFAYTSFTNLDLSSFDTSNVTRMGSMFAGSHATSLDLSSFDTSNVIYMEKMFYSSATTTLDLSSFDTSNVTNMNQMFNGSVATIGYARTQLDADRFNSVAGSLSNGNDPDTYIPNALRFVVR